MATRPRWPPAPFMNMKVVAEDTNSKKVIPPLFSPTTRRTSFFGLTPPQFCISKLNRRKKVAYHYYTLDGGSRYEPTDDECRYLEREQTRADEMKNVGHRFITERQIYRDWAPLFNFSFHHPSWTGV